MRVLRSLVLLMLAAVLAACTAMTTISSSHPGATVTIASSTASAIPRSDTFSATSFGNYEFRAEAPGLEPFYGLLPLKFNGGYLALDILFFAPAAFFNLREVYAFYDFDIAKKQVRYKQTEAEGWTIYEPLTVEIERAKKALDVPPK